MAKSKETKGAKRGESRGERREKAGQAPGETRRLLQSMVWKMAIFIRVDPRAHSSTGASSPIRSLRPLLLRPDLPRNPYQAFSRPKHPSKRCRGGRILALTPVLAT